MVVVCGGMKWEKLVFPWLASVRFLETQRGPITSNGSTHGPTGIRWEMPNSVSLSEYKPDVWAHSSSIAHAVPARAVFVIFNNPFVEEQS